MKRIKYFTIAAAALLAAACSEKEGQEQPVVNPDARVFYADIESSGSQSKVFNNGLDIYWEGSDYISIFDHGSSNRQYYARTQNGFTAATFYYYGSDIPEPEGTEPYAYAFFPYSEGNVFSSGTVSFELPATQKCTWSDCFSGDSNPMMAVTEDNILMFKNLCGYLVLKLYGTDCSVSSIVLSANGGETLCGPASATMALGGTPELSMEGLSTGSEITLECDSPIQLGNSADKYTSFWFVLPPVVMSDGITVTITDSNGGVFRQSMSSPVEITRNNITKMAPLEVTPSYTDISVGIENLLHSIGEPCKLFNNPDDWEFLMLLFCNDVEGADTQLPDSGYNYFATCIELSSRNPNYRNPRIRYQAPMNMITEVNKLLSKVSGSEQTALLRSQTAQIRALRAWSYLLIARQYQFNYMIAADEPCVPLETENTVDPGNNPRASVREIYNFILQDLDYAVTNLEGFVREHKMQVDAAVAHGLRARAYLDMGEWEKAYNDADAVAQLYYPATLAEVSVPSFMSIDEHNWVWGYDMPAGYPASLGSNGRYATTSSWLRSFSGNAYATSCTCYTSINKLLWDKIPQTDVRKGWWVDENLESPLLDGLAWPGCTDVANATTEEKTPFLPYTNVKFGCNPIATMANDEDMPLMRVEEMLLIMAEAKARMGDNATAVNILETFVLNNRDPYYSVDAGGRTLLDEIWFQRRVELWGEGFGLPDILRLNKPLVRFHEDTYVDDAYHFNMASNDPWLLLRFPTTAVSSNPALVNNDGGNMPVPGQNPELRDGVTD